MNRKKIEIVVPEKIAVYEHQHTRVKSVVFPFQFADGVNGILTITSLSRAQFNPSEKIESITINFK